MSSLSAHSRCRLRQPDAGEARRRAHGHRQQPGLQPARLFQSRENGSTLEGMFGDPVYGGNKNFAGWDLIHYPGAKLAAGPEDQSMKTSAQALSP